eukprot:g3604.t1
MVCQRAIPTLPNFGINCINKAVTATGNNEGVTCLPCSPGTYLAENSSYPSCVPCFPGRATNKHGQASCDACSPGKYANTQGLETCAYCDPGKYGNNTVTCIDVPPGTYPTNCYDPSSSKGCSEIEDCPRGFYCPSKTLEPVRCKPGTYTNITGSPQCSTCTSGRVNIEYQATKCNACVKGKYAPREGLETCTTCNDGKTTFNKGSEECSDCPIGKSGTNGICNSCTNGRYQDEVGHTTCKNCKEGKRSAGTTCTQCLAGKYLSGKICKGCSTGKYSAAGAAKCLDCPKGKWTNHDSSGCNDCPAGFYGLLEGQTNQSDACVQCEKGKFSSSIGADSKDLCNDCPLGTASNVVGANNSKFCLPCDKGKVANTSGSIVCSTCPNGAWATGGKDVTTGTGSTLCRECGLGKFLNKTVCSLCPVGKFQDRLGQIACRKCKTGHSIPTRTTCTMCHAGGYLKGNECVACEKGKYSLAGNSKCVGCLLGQYAKLDIKNPNIYPVATSSGCYLCRSGLYGIKQGETKASNACHSCPKGKFGTATGADSIKLCNDCPLGTASNVVGANNSKFCLPCDKGKVANMSGSKLCHVCSVGYVAGGASISNGQLGATLCQPCSVGKHGVDKAEKCESCSQGKFQNREGTKRCNECLPGFYSGFEGLPKCIECPPGRANTFKDRHACNACEIGRFANVSGLKECFRCGDGESTYINGSVACLPCQKGKAGRNGNCNFCYGENQYSDVEGLKHCKICPGATVPDKVHILCTSRKTHGPGPTITVVHASNFYRSLYVEWDLPQLNNTSQQIQDIIIVPINADTGKEETKSITKVGGIATSISTKPLLKLVTNQVYQVRLFIKYNNFVSENATWGPRWTTTSDCSTSEVYLGMYILFS